MIDCPQCGFANPDSNKFCQNCGTIIAEVVVSNQGTIEQSVISTISAAESPIGAIAEIFDLDTDTEVEQTFSAGGASSETSDDTAGDITNAVEETEITEVDNLLPELISLDFAGLTDVGLERDHNEDNFFAYRQITTIESPTQGTVEEIRGLFVLCDGMGGHAGGEVASAIAIAKITEQFEPFWRDRLPGEQKLREIIESANDAIYDRNEAEMRREVGRMGTTLVIMANYGAEVAIAHVGDSRIYQVTSDNFFQITRDHEVANRLIDQGIDAETAYARPDAHQLTQAIGPSASFQIKPSIKFLRLSQPTLFLLCSDGLCDNDLVEQNWQTHLLPQLAERADLKTAVKALIDLANRFNGHDNITTILVNCQVE